MSARRIFCGGILERRRRGIFVESGLKRTKLRRSEIIWEYAAPTELEMLFGLGATKISRLRRLKFVSRQNVGWNYICAERASWRLANFSNCVNAAGWTFRKIAFCIEFDESVITFAFNIRPDVVYRDNIVRFYVVFQSPLILCGINLSHIVYASIGRTGSV